MPSHFHTFSKAVSLCRDRYHPTKKVIEQVGRQMHKRIFNYNRVMHVTQNNMGLSPGLGVNIKWTWVAGVQEWVSLRKNSGAKCHLMKFEHVSADIEDSLEGFR